MAQRKLEDLIGQRFGILTVLRRGPNYAEPSGAIRAQWFCVCDCGGTHTATGHAMKAGRVQSCGCLMGKHSVKHGKSRDPVYRQWNAMRQRCENPNSTNYNDYGGRGIKVCDRWRDFSAFYEDMGDPPPKGTLERIDNDRGYEPGNVKWASRKEQAHNRRSNEFLTHAGKTLTLSQWGEITGLGKAAIVRRRRAGWPVDRILWEPMQNTGRRRSAGKASQAASAASSE